LRSGDREFPAMKTNEDKIIRSGKEIPSSTNGIVCAYDGLFRILKVPMEDGSTFEVVQERMDNGTIRGEYVTQLMRMRRGDEISIVT
jgi:hypothetical protein